MSSLAHTRREGLKLRKDGSAELGLFMTDEDHSHWIANGFPSNWQSEEILRFLAEQQWQDVSVINRRAKRKDTPTWWLRARPPGEGESAQDSYVYEVDGHGWGCNRIYLNKAPPKAVRSNYMQYIQGSKETMEGTVLQGRPELLWQQSSS
jgi:hypothetical protein